MQYKYQSKTKESPETDIEKKMLGSSNRCLPILVKNTNDVYIFIINKLCHAI